MPAAKTATAISAHAVVGSDDGGVKAAAKELAAKLSPGGDFGMEIIDGASANSDEAADRIDSAIQALLTFPFFGGGKLVWLKSASFLGDDPMGRSEAVLAALEKLVATLESGLPDGTVFLLSATPIDKRRSFYKTLQKVAKVQIIEALDTSRSGWEEDAARLVREAADQRGLTLAGDCCELLALMTGGDRRQIENEIEKLDLYLDKERREVREEDVRLLVPMSHVGVVFELGNALAARKTGRALELLEQLVFHGEKAIGILLASIIPTVRSLLLAKDLMVRHRLKAPAQPFYFAKDLERLPAAATAHLPRKKDGTVNAFALGLAMKQAHRFSESELRTALHACLEANVKLVTSSLDAKVVLTELIVRIGAGAHA
ncbi:MAG: DNA polymerase III subunit delta [Chthoniobacteraceae bacterium]